MSAFAPKPTNAERVAGIILAAGDSSRMGTNKLLLEFEGMPIVRRVAVSAVDAGLSPIIVVLGFAADNVRRALSGIAIDTVINPNYRRGMNSSVRCGLERVPMTVPAAIVLLGDMPLVTSAMIEKLVATYQTHRVPLVASRFGPVQAPPTLFDRALFTEFGADGDGAGRQIVMEYAQQGMAAEFPATSLADLDSPQDYEQLKRRT